MSSIRTFIMANSRLAAVFLALALCMKLLVPNGFMPEVRGHGISIEVCEGSSGGHRLTSIEVPQGGKAPSGKHAKADGICPFTALAQAVHPVDAAFGPASILAIAGILAGIVLAAATPHRKWNLRPPLRGPPANV